MSQAVTVDPADAGAPPAADAAIEIRARAAGWKDRHEFPNGPPSNWMDAAAFLERSNVDPGLLRVQLERLQKQNTRLVREFEETKGLVVTQTAMLKSAEERALARARVELQAQKTKAIEAGDVVGVMAADRELETLKPTAPAAPPPPAAPAAAPGAAVSPQAAAFVARNAAWFNVDPEMTRRADQIHIANLNLHPTWTLQQNFEETERQLAEEYPEHFPNARRRRPAPVGGSADGPAPPPSNAKRTFEAMPADVKQQFHRQEKLLAGKGQPLTKEEFAGYYWSQFEEVP
jgi:hypothetical protein